MPNTAGTLVQGWLNDTQTYAVEVPGQVVTDLVGERVEDVQVERGSAQLWFQAVGPDGQPAVQLRWFTGSQEVCESFTVTVGGGSEDEHRHAAVDLAERVLMSGELPDDPTHPTPGGNPLAGSEWQLEQSTIDGVSTEGGGSIFSFTGREVEWSDGCNAWTAPYVYADDAITLDSGTGDEITCDGNPTSDAIRAVMTGGPVAVTFEGDFLELRAGGGELTLRPLVRDADPVGSEGEVTDTTLSPTTSTVPASTTTTIP